MSSPADDPTIADGEALWRRIRPDWVVFDANQQRLRPKSIAFQNYRGTDAMSVILAHLRGTPESAVNGKHRGYFLVQFSAGLVRRLKQGVVPFDDPDEPGHHHVVGKKTGSVQRELTKEATWVVAPPGGFDPDSHQASVSTESS